MVNSRKKSPEIGPREGVVNLHIFKMTAIENFKLYYTLSQKTRHTACVDNLAKY